jgi:hypothetical protein
MAAHSGQLEAVPGIGRRRAEAVRDSVDALLSRSGRRRSIRNRRIAGHHQESSVDPHRPTAEPTVETILEVDTEYRQKASAGSLRTIALRRFNPESRAWLPILHTEKNGWHFTALYSNTARAHELDRAKDWVVVYFDRDGTENRSTVVTESAGPLKGQRVVRGREPECLKHYHQYERSQR